MSDTDPTQVSVDWYFRRAWSFPASGSLFRHSEYAARDTQRRGMNGKQCGPCSSPRPEVQECVASGCPLALGV